MRIQKIADPIELNTYQELTERWLGIRFPTSYLSAAEVYAAFDDCGNMVGGFCIQTQLPFRVLNSIPGNAPQPNENEAVELTGLWFRPSDARPAGRIYFWLALCAKFFRHIHKDIFFGYESSQIGLARTYASAKPEIVFAGVTQLQPGMTEVADEVICRASGFRIALLPLFCPEFYFKRLFRRSNVPKLAV